MIKNNSLAKTWLIIALALTLGIPASSTAQIFFDVQSEPTTLMGADFYVHDFHILTNANVLELQLLLDIDQGVIYQHEFGLATPPSTDFIGAFPDLAFDTFVTLGALTALIAIVSVTIQYNPAANSGVGCHTWPPGYI